MATAIKLKEPERLTDNADGGGQMTGNEVISGQVNNLFTDISRLDRTIGRISLRLPYLHYDTANNNLLAGTHAIVTNPPADDNIDVVLFEVDNEGSQRAAALVNVENQKIRGKVTDLIMQGNAPAGALIISFISYSRFTPSVDDVIFLVQDDGLPSELSEYKKIKAFTLTEQFALGGFNQTYVAYHRIDIEFHEPLANTYAPDVNASNVKVYETNTSDNAKFYGVTKLAVDANLNDTAVQVEETKKFIFPVSQNNNVLSAVSPFSVQMPLFSSHEAVVIDPADIIDLFQNGITIDIGIGVRAGTLQIDIDSMTVGTQTGTNLVYSDDSNGKLTPNDPAFGNILIDYDTGVLSREAFSNITACVNPQAAFIGREYHTIAPNTAFIDINSGNQGLAYTQVLNPAPYLPSLRIQYSSNGVLYTVSSDENGLFTGAAVSFNDINNTLSLTLTRLPDVNSAIVFTFGSEAHYQNRHADTNVKPYVVQTLSNPIAPSSLTISWNSNGVAKTATDNGAGVIAGDATGGVSYASSQVVFSPDSIPDNGTTFQYDYNDAVLASETITVSGDSPAFTLANLPVVQNSVEVFYDSSIQYPILAINEPTFKGAALPNGARGLIAETGSGVVVDANGAVKELVFDRGGSLRSAAAINYTTGACTLDRVRPFTSKFFNFKQDVNDWVDLIENNTHTNTDLTVVYLQNTGTPTAQTENFPANFVIDLLPRSGAELIDASFDFGGIRHTLSGNNVLNNVGAVVGSVNYANNRVSLTAFNEGVNVGFVQHFNLSRLGDYGEYEFRFFSSGRPIDHASMSITGTHYQDGSISAVNADAGGVLTSTYMDGSVNGNLGVVSVKLGELVLKTSVDSEPWYDPTNEDFGVNTWQPKPFDLASLQYSAIHEQITFDHDDLIGIDSLLLPNDGKVDIFSPGDVAVIHYTDTEQFGATASSGSVHVLTGSDYTAITLEDANGTTVPDTLYTVNLATTTVTMENPVDLSAFTQPLVAKKTAEQMALINSVDHANKTIALNAALDRAYAAANSFVSSALLFGDIEGRYDTIFDQQTWSGEWSDTLIGNAASANYDNVNFPMVLENDSAINERWRLDFTSATVFNIIGERLGTIGTGNTSTDVAPLNPVTGKPYFVMPAGGFGSGWAAGNQIRRNTYAAARQFAIARVTLPGPEEQPDDNFIIQLRGDVPQ